MTCFADEASAVVTDIVDNRRIAKDTMRLRICVPEMARQVVPGQFFMIRNPGGNDPLIGRAFAIYDVDLASGWLDLVYLVKGKLTSSLVKLSAGQQIAVWGPLGNGFPPQPTEHLVMVAGGIGQTPFVALAKEALGQQAFRSGERANGYARRVSFCYGVRSADYLAGVEDFRRAGAEVHIATEDGSLGTPKLVTDILRDVLDASSEIAIRVVCCGPEPMMEAVAHIAAVRNIECQVSLETPMACGIGICFSCVAKIGAPDDWDYKRTCVEGPVFDAREIVWQ
jgi:dihydroorotate dehydrogenase electron transfer subunit